jgi:hypothetical protein
MMKRFWWALVVIGAVILPSAGQTQVLTPSRIRLDTLIRVPLPAPPTFPAATGMRICVDCNGMGGPRPGKEPAFVIKDAAMRVLAMVPPGDTSALNDPRHPLRLLEREMIAAIDVVTDSALVRVLGRGFENGLLVFTLSPAGTEAWRRAIARKETPP